MIPHIPRHLWERDKRVRGDAHTRLVGLPIRVFVNTTFTVVILERTFGTGCQGKNYSPP